MPKLDKDCAQLRDGTADLETGVGRDSIGPEVRPQALLPDRFVGWSDQGSRWPKA
jgi:hypothetical protein